MRELTPWNLLKRINDVKDAQMVLQMAKLCASVCENKKYFAATQNETCLRARNMCFAYRFSLRIFAFALSTNNIRNRSFQFHFSVLHQIFWWKVSFILLKVYLAQSEDLLFEILVETYLFYWCSEKKRWQSIWKEQ